MTDAGSVAVIGLGHMGSAIASAFVASGRTVVIWNRTWEKAAPLASHALVAASPVEACEVADTVVVSLLDYSAVADVLHTAEVEQTLSGKTVVQLSTGTPSEARREGEWAAARGISYIDGAILGYPRAIGTEQIVVLCAGRRALFDEKLAALRALGGEPIYCGEAVDAASILDLALIHVLFVLVTGILHSAALCDGEGFPLETFFGALPAWVAGVMTTLPETQRMVTSGTFTGGNSAMTTNARAARHVVEASEACGIDGSLAKAISELFQATVDRGHGGDDLPAVYSAFSRLMIGNG